VNIIKVSISFLLFLTVGCTAASSADVHPTAAGTKKPAEAAHRLKFPTRTPSPAPSPSPRILLVIDDFEDDTTDWKACVDSECAGSCAVDVDLVRNHAVHGNRALQLNFATAGSPRAVFYIERPMDLSSGSDVRFTVFHEGALDGVGFALTTGEGRVWYESGMVAVASGKRIPVAFDLSASVYRTETADQELHSRIADRDRVVRISIVLYTRKSGSAVIDYLRLTEGA
jgi:hypothetical protein